MDRLRYDERVALARLGALLELLPAALDRHLATTGLTSFEFTLLEALHEADGSRLRLSALASRTNATLPRLSRVVTGLERKGLVARVACEQDGRATTAVLTPAGVSAFQEGRPLYEDAVRHQVLDGLDDDGVARLAEVSYAILTRLDPGRRLAVTVGGLDTDGGHAGSASDACPSDPARPSYA